MKVDTNESLLRFILIISIGFAVGGIVAGLGIIWGSFLLGTIFEPIQYSSEGYNFMFIELVRSSIWGAIGGLGIGIAIKKDKLLLTLLGGLGFGIGVLVSMFIGVLSYNIVTNGIIGILEGFSLSFYYRNSKFFTILAICGLVGFGAGSLIGAIIYRVILGSIVGTIILGNDVVAMIIILLVTGLIGGTALGYGIYSMRRSHSAGG